MTVGILVVSHSAKIAEGVVDLARQMAADVPFVAAGGTDDGGIGTSFEAISAGITTLHDGGVDAIVVLCDLGSAYLTTDTALDFLDDDLRASVHVSDAPLVEGTVAGAVAAQTGAAVDGVLAAASTAGGAEPANTQSTASAAGGSDASPGSEVEPEVVSGSATLVNASGLHARPAATFVKTAAAFDADVRVNGVDAKSLLAIMALALPQGASVHVEGRGPDAENAVHRLLELIEDGFGEGTSDAPLAGS
jgi:phosphoenolpyruvate---glycerone phosphotransferase subunit DhaM